MKISNIRKTIQALTEGILGYRVFISKCKIYEVYTEYLFYEPIHRILNQRGFKVRHEVPLKKETKKQGDNKRIDFALTAFELSAIPKVLIEVKFLRNFRNTHDFSKDSNKMIYFDELNEMTKLIFVIFSKKVKDKNKSLKLKDIPKVKLSIYHEREIPCVNNIYCVTVFEVNKAE